LIAAAAELFERQGYDETTVAEIAGGADIGTRTFFGYFASKGRHPVSRQRHPGPDHDRGDRQPRSAAGPVDVLVRALDTVAETDADMTGPMAAVRMRLFRTVRPCAQGVAGPDAVQQQIARELHATFPAELDPVTAAAWPSFYRAVSGALTVLRIKTTTPPGTPLSCRPGYGRRPSWPCGPGGAGKSFPRVVGSVAGLTP